MNSVLKNVIAFSTDFGFERFLTLLEIVLIFAFVSSANGQNVDQESISLGNIEAGKRLYNEGVLASGDRLEATVQGDLKLTGKFVACAKCHRRSGRGAAEGARLVPPIHANILFADRTADRARLFRNLYQEDHPPETDARISSRILRPAYSDETLARVWSSGIDVNGKRLQQLMPRYRFSKTDQQNLIAYLRILGADSPSSNGVSDSEIHFATVITSEVPSHRRRAMLDVLHAFVDCHNLEVQRYLARPQRSTNYKREFTRTLRQWRLHLWELDGEPDTWETQLAAKHEMQPVFALLGGLSNSSWNPIHQFSERNEIPCMFPNTNLPEESKSDYTFYFHGGVLEEARMAASALTEQKSKQSRPLHVVQIFDQTPKSVAGKEELLRHLPQMATTDEICLDRESEEDFEKRVVGHQLVNVSHVMVWLSDNDPQVLQRIKDCFSPNVSIYASRLSGNSPANSDVANIDYFVEPLGVGQHSSPDLFRVRQWLLTRQVYDADHEPLQLNTYFSMLLAKHSIRHLVDDLDPNYFMEWAEHECESALNPGVYRRLSLGPGQRFATKLTETKDDRRQK